MKILVVQDALRSGGTERQSIQLTRSFAAAGEQSRLITFRPGGVLGPATGDIDRRSLQPFDTRLDWFAPGIARTVSDFRPDIILCMGRMANCLGGRLQAIAPAAAVVATLRTGKNLPWLFRRSLHRVRHVVANSREAREILVRRHRLPESKISVIHNALLLAPEASARKDGLPWRDRFGAEPDTLVLLCVAMFRPEKNQRELVEIVAGLPAALNWQLWLAGDGPARPACERLARELKVGDRVKFPGLHPDPSELYAAADLAVHASRTESLSNFLIEAQALGLPAVAYEAQGVGECFISGQTGWVIPAGDISAFRSALLRLGAEPPAVRAKRSGEARAFARAAFDPARQVAAYLEIFRRLAP